MHNAVSDLEARAVQACEDFEADTHPCLRACCSPAGCCGRGSGEQHLHVGLGVAYAERESVRRQLGADGVAAAGLIELERVIQMGFEGGLAVGAAAFPVDFRARHFGERAPIAARFDGGEGMLERVFVLGK